MTTDVAKAGFQQKVIGVPLSKGIAKDEKGFVIVRGKFTSDNRDEVGDIITRSATERAIPKYRQWGNIRYMHGPEPVGRVLRIGVEDGLDWNEVEICVIDPKAAFQVENGLLKALSVGILFTMKDVDFLEDGGIIINDYMLAEISLVDHPANYDAALNLKLDSQDRVMARQLGIHAFLQTRSLKENLPMETEKAAQAAEVVTPAPSEVPAEPVAETPSEPVAEEPKAETPEEVKTVETAAEAIAEAHNEQPVESVAEETPAPVAEEAAPAAEPVAVEASVSVPAAVDPIEKTLEALLQITTNLVEVTRNLAPKAEVPAQQVEAQADASVPQAPETVVEPEEKEAGVAANRKGAVVPEAKPVEETRVSENGEAPAEEKPKSLRDAVRKFVDSKPH